MKIKFFVSMMILLLALGSSCKTTKEKTSNIKTEKYNWKNVQIVGGGFVDGIIFHPAAKKLIYARTDMGGAYRWKERQKRWMPLLDWLSYEDTNLMGVESITVDPSDTNKVYLSCGTYTAPDVPNGAVLISNNRGKTFTRVNMPFKMGGNENGRGNGERMAVDPKNGEIVYLGTRHDGLWRSTDGGMSWKNVTSFPDVKEVPPSDLSENEIRRWMWNEQGSGIIFVLFNPAGSTSAGCRNIYAGVSLMNRDNLFESNDGGNTWHPVSGQPTGYRPTHGVLASDGMLYISYADKPGPSRMTNGAVWKQNTRTGEWSDITPDKPNQSKQFGYGAVAVDASNPEVIIASTHYRPQEAGGDDIFRSVNGGKTWKAVFANGTKFDYSKAPYVQKTGIHWMFDIEIDPFNPDHAIFTTGFGGYETFNLTNVDKGLKTDWNVYTTGIEETVPLELLSPPEGAQLITAIGDYGGFVHYNLDKPVPEGNFDNPHFGNTDGVACAWLKPEIIVRVGVCSGNRNCGNIGYSTDYGKSWQPAGQPSQESTHGSIAVSSNGTTWVWTPQWSKPYYTTNNGKNWTMIESLPGNARVVADKVNPQKFYAVNLNEGLLYSSDDGAKNFSASKLNLKGGIIEKDSKRGDRRGGQDRIYTTPGIENDLWIAAFDGLYHSPKENQKFVLQPHVSQVYAFGFGKPAPDSEYPALYLIGIVDGVRGIFRSDNCARSWIRINDDQHQWGLLLQITGDPKRYGRVYVGAHGRGAIYGDPAM